MLHHIEGISRIIAEHDLLLKPKREDGFHKEQAPLKGSSTCRQLCPHRQDLQLAG